MQLAENPSASLKDKIPEESFARNREIDEFGELAVRHIKQVQKRLTPEEVETLILEYRSGKNLVELGKEFGCHSTTVSRLLAKKGIEKPPHSNDSVEEIVAKYQTGESVRTIAKKSGLSHKTISKMLKEHGITVNRRRAQAKLDAQKVAQMYEDMHTTKEIAQHFGVSPKAILTCLQEQRIKIRSRWDYPAGN